MQQKEYNGWTNYETQVVKLWMDNEEGSYNYWTNRANELLEESKDTLSNYAKLTGREIFTDKEKAALRLADELKEQHEEALPEINGFAADLLSAAMSEVNWQEIATSIIDDCQPVAS